MPPEAAAQVCSLRRVSSIRDQDLDLLAVVVLRERLAEVEPVRLAAVLLLAPLREELADVLFRAVDDLAVFDREPVEADLRLRVAAEAVVPLRELLRAEVLPADEDFAVLEREPVAAVLRAGEAEAELRLREEPAFVLPAEEDFAVFEREPVDEDREREVLPDVPLFARVPVDDVLRAVAERALVPVAFVRLELRVDELLLVREPVEVDFFAVAARALDALPRADVEEEEEEVLFLRVLLPLPEALDCLGVPEPPRVPPPSLLFTVAQARRFASGFETPRSS